MKLQVTQERLNAALSIVGRVATTRSALPVLANVLIRASKNKVFITATNLEIAITQTFTGKIEKDGALTIPARLLTDYIASIPNGTVDMKIEANKLYIHSGTFSSTINGVSADEFPTLPAIRHKTTLSIPANELKTALQQTIIAASHDETRPVLTGAYLHTYNNQLYIAATDSYRLAQKRLSITSDDEVSLIIPSSALGDVLRIIGDGGEADDDEANIVKISYDDSQVEFVYKNTELITRQIDGTFPSYRQLIPEKSDVSIVVSKNELQSITKVASLFARESAGSITLDASSDDQSVSITSVASQVGQNTSKASAKIKGNGKVTLNSRYLIDALNVVDAQIVRYRFSGTISPCVLEPDTKNPDYLHIIMPLKS